MPVTRGKDGSETYSMNPAYGRALQQAREADAEKSSRQPATDIHFHRNDDGSIQSRITRGDETPAGKDETASHDSAEDASGVLMDEWGDVDSSEIGSGNE